MVIIWKDEYKLGIEKIDKQHKKFFTICANIMDLTEKANQGKKINKIRLVHLLMELRTYAFYHFYSEERYMISKQYPDFFAHSSLHDSFIERLLVFQKLTRDIYSQTESDQDRLAELIELAHEMAKFTVNWYKEHIVEIDGQYADFAKKQLKRYTRQRQLNER